MTEPRTRPDPPVEKSVQSALSAVYALMKPARNGARKEPEGTNGGGPRPHAVGKDRAGSGAKWRVLLVDDHEIFREGLKSVIKELPEFAICGEEGSAGRAMASFRAAAPDVVITAISMAGSNGLELIKMMLAEKPKVAVLVLSAQDEAVYGLRALRAGARGYLMKSAPMSALQQALEQIMRGQTYVSVALGASLIFRAIQMEDGGSGSLVDLLSDRELEVLAKIGRGHSTREIAAALHLSPKTVETHRAHAKSKLNLDTGAALVQFATEWVANSEEEEERRAAPESGPGGERALGNHRPKHRAAP